MSWDSTLHLANSHKLVNETKQNKRKYKWIFRAVIVKLWQTYQRWYATKLWVTCQHSPHPKTVLKNTWFGGTVWKWDSYVVSRTSKKCAKIGHIFLSLSDATDASPNAAVQCGLDWEGGRYRFLFSFAWRGVWHASQVRHFPNFWHTRSRRFAITDLEQVFFRPLESSEAEDSSRTWGGFFEKLTWARKMPA